MRVGRPLSTTAGPGAVPAPVLSKMKTRSTIAYGSAAPWTGSARTWTVRFGLGHANNVHVPNHSAPAHDGAQPGIVMIGRVRGSWSAGWGDPVPPAGTGTVLVPNVMCVVEDAR